MRMTEGAPYRHGKFFKGGRGPLYVARIQHKQAAAGIDKIKQISAGL